MQSHIDFPRTARLAPPLPLAGEADAPRAMRSIVPRAAGEGSHHTGTSSAISTIPMRRHPHPSPPPQAGEGPHCRCRGIVHVIRNCPAGRRGLLGPVYLRASFPALKRKTAPREERRIEFFIAALAQYPQDAQFICTGA